MYSEEFKKRLDEVSLAKLYNACVTSSSIPYDEVTFSAIYFLMKYNEEETRKCLYLLMERAIKEELVFEMLKLQ